MREDEKRFIEILKQTKIDCREAVSAISNMINSFVINTFDIVSEIRNDEKAKKNMDTLSNAWIYSCAECFLTNRYDYRNEIACKLCLEYKMANHIDINDGIWINIANSMTKEHRTLQQSFTRFVFKYLELTDENFYEKMKKAGYDGIPSLPMI